MFVSVLADLILYIYEAYSIYCKLTFPITLSEKLYSMNFIISLLMLNMWNFILFICIIFNYYAFNSQVSNSHTYSSIRDDLIFFISSVTLSTLQIFKLDKPFYLYSNFINDISRNFPFYNENRFFAQRWPTIRKLFRSNTKKFKHSLHNHNPTHEIVIVKPNRAIKRHFTTRHRPST